METKIVNVNNDDLMIRPDEDYLKILEDICLDLNLNTFIKDDTWNIFSKIDINYMLEGNKKEWLLCAIFGECMNKKLPTIDSPTYMTSEANCISLIKLLRYININILTFFDKMKKWCSMASSNYSDSNVSNDLRYRINTLERKFHVTKCLFYSKFISLFNHTFHTTDLLTKADDNNFMLHSIIDKLIPDLGEKNCTNQDLNKEDKETSIRNNRKNLSKSDIFEFSWLFFVFVKGKVEGMSEDLVNSFNLLLCCLDLIFSDYINNCHKMSLTCLIDKEITDALNEKDLITLFCESTHSTSLLLDVKTYKVYEFENHLKSLQITLNPALKTDSNDTLKGMIKPANYEYNWQKLNKLYEEIFISTQDGFIDERIFLGESFISAKINTPTKLLKNYNTSSTLDDIANQFENPDLDQDNSNKNNGDASIKKHVNSAKKKLSDYFDKTTDSHVTLTPLLGRKFLVHKCRSADDPSLMTTSANLNEEELQRSISGGSFTRSDNKQMVKLKGIMHSYMDHRSVLTSLDEPGAIKEVEDSKVIETNSDVVSEVDDNDLLVILRKCKQSTIAKMVDRLNACEEKFVKNYNYPAASKTPTKEDYIREIFDTGCSLYFCLLEKILAMEKNTKFTSTKQNASFDYTTLLEHSDFNTSVLALALEITIFSSSSSHDVALSHSLPHSVNQQQPYAVLGLSAYAFYRVIELCIRAQDKLSREMVKHLNKIEEGILESVVWHNDSLLWGILKNNPVPWCKEVFNSRNIEYVSSSFATFTPPSVLKTIHRHIPPSTTSLGSLLLTPVNEPENHENNRPNKDVKPVKNGSLALFFRKVYHLTSIRLRDLCKKLDIASSSSSYSTPNILALSDPDLSSKMETLLLHAVWTCFEQCLVQSTAVLFKGRHVDQIIMCCVYVMSKVTGHDKSFADIMKQYRTQPQARNNVYRSVLIQDSNEHISPPTLHPDQSDFNQNDVSRIRSSSTLPHHINNKGPDPSRGDIITFYNSVFVEEIKNFATKFASFCDIIKNPTTPICHSQLTPVNLLSPLPLLTPLSGSPAFGRKKKVSVGHFVYVSPLKPSPSLSKMTAPLGGVDDLLSNRSTSFVFTFDQSPSKDLDKLNKIIKQNHQKLFTTNNLGSPNSTSAKTDTNNDINKEPNLIKRLKLDLLCNNGNPSNSASPGNFSAKRGLQF
ncbi:unnamed protein product [Gordionus sp. m RMFG-2023]